MSALHLVLPRLQAMATGTRGLHVAGSIASAINTMQVNTMTDREPAQTFAPGRRKGPHSLRLVQAQAAAVSQAPALPMPAPRALPVRPQPQLAFYRKYTEAMLRRYLSMSMAAGRVPSLLGRDLFRGNVSHRTVTGFDDVIIFVEDVNKCLAKLEPTQRFFVRKIAMEGYTQGETAALRGLPLRSVIRRYTEAIDKLTRLFLERKLLQEMGDVDLED